MVLTAPEKSKPPLARYDLRLPLPRVAPASSRLVDPTTDLSQIKISVIPSAARDPSSIFAPISQLTRLSSRPKWPVLLFRAVPSATGHAVEACPEPRRACPESAKGICFFRLATRHSPLATAFPARLTFPPHSGNLPNANRRPHQSRRHKNPHNPQIPPGPHTVHRTIPRSPLLPPSPIYIPITVPDSRETARTLPRRATSSPFRRLFSPLVTLHSPLPHVP